MGPNGTQSRCVKSLRDGRWDFTVLAFFRSKAFYASRLSPERRCRENLKIFPCSLFYDVYGDERQNWDPFSHFASKMKVIHVFKAKNVAFRVIFRAKWKMTHFDSF